MLQQVIDFYSGVAQSLAPLLVRLLAVLVAFRLLTVGLRWLQRVRW